MGHTDTRMTNRYCHLSVENLRDAIMAMDDTNGHTQQAKNKG